MEPESSRQTFEKSSNIKFHENPSSGSRVVPCGRTDRQTDVTKLLAACAILQMRLKLFSIMRMQPVCYNVGTAFYIPLVRTGVLRINLGNRRR
jgi:hypothetical protein